MFVLAAVTAAVVSGPAAALRAAVAVLAGLLAAELLRRIAVRRLGGMTGDVFGAQVAVSVHDLRVPEFEHPRVDVLVREARELMLRHFMIVELGENEAALSLASEGRARLMAVALKLQALDLPAKKRKRLDELRTELRNALGPRPQRLPCAVAERDATQRGIAL